jgi:hypothetical protein
MADRAVATWSGGRNTEAVDELAQAVEGNAQGRRDVAAALSAPVGGVVRHHAEGGTSLDNPEAPPFRSRWPATGR